jgi:hypothetical protein
MRKKCLKAQNKLAYDKPEFEFARSMLENKNGQFWKPDQDIPDSEIVKFFEDQKNMTLRKIKKQEKEQKTREFDKHKEQERIIQEKTKKFFAEENSKKFDLSRRKIRVKAEDLQG